MKRAGKRIRLVGAGVAGRKGGDPWVARRPVPLPLPTMGDAPQASPSIVGAMPCARPGWVHVLRYICSFIRQQ